MKYAHCKVFGPAAAAGILAASVVAAGFAGGCATPARPELDQFTEEPLEQPFNGRYVATFHTRWFGPVYGHVTVERTDTGFKANSPPGVAWNLVGGLERVLGELFVPFLFPRGMLLVWNSTMPDPAHGVVGEGWIGPATIDPWRMSTRMESPDSPAVIRYRDGRALAVVTLQRDGPGAMPPTDYGSLCDSLQGIVREKYFDPDAGNSAEMEAFFRDVRTAIPKVDDDVTFLAAVALAWRKRSDVALPIPYRRPVPESDRLLASVQNPIAPLSVTYSEQSGIATLEAVVFRDPAQVDAAMRDVLSRNPKGLIVDLRNCTGMDLSALGVLPWLLDKQVDCGVFFSGARRGELAEGQAQQSVEEVSIGGASDARTVENRLDNTGAVRVSVNPSSSPYRGPVVVLTSSRTRSSGEMLAWLLKENARAKVVGEPTPGRTRFSREHELGQGFVVRLDEFDWRPAGLDGPVRQGIKPDISVSRQKAPARAAKLLKPPNDA